MSAFRWLARFLPSDDTEPNPLCYGARCRDCGLFLDKPERPCPMCEGVGRG